MGKSLVDDNNQPLEKLTPEVRSWLRSLGSTATTTRELMEEDSPEVQARITEALHRVNNMSVSKAARVHKFIFVPVDFSTDGRELTPTMKMARHAVLKKYAAEVEAMYSGEFHTDGLFSSSITQCTIAMTNPVKAQIKLGRK